MEEEYEYGQPIPEKYRNRLYDWDGGGYSGCLWESNQGLVDKDGHWHPIYSTGWQGLDQHEWYRNKIGCLKADLGYDVRDADAQHSEAQYEAVKAVFGKEWYMIDVAKPDDPRVQKLMEKENARYAEFVKRRKEYRQERTHRLDQMFMSVVLGQDNRDNFREIGLIDDVHIKETCKAFCQSYKCNVGMMTNCLDKLANMGYEPWCTCSDCGEQFQLGDFESFGCSVDQNAYTGDNGIGVIMRRILCDECHENAECKVCYELDLPNRNKPDHGASDWESYDFLACILHAWLDVCWGCASGYECDHLYRWDEAARQRIRTPLGEQYAALEEALMDEYGKKGHALYVAVTKTPEGRAKINGIRDLLEESVEDKFGSSVSEDWFKDRLDINSVVQDKLPGVL